MLAQFLVAKALGDSRPRDDGWLGDFDVLTSDGIRVEVKSSGYLQSWRQKKLSEIKFSGLKARSWTPETGYSIDPEFHSDVYVFAVHTCQDPSIYDPLDLDAWIFYVHPAQVIHELGQKSIALARLSGLAGASHRWSELPQAVVAAVGQPSEK